MAKRNIDAELIISEIPPDARSLFYYPRTLHLARDKDIALTISHCEKFLEGDGGRPKVLERENRRRENRPQIVHRFCMALLARKL